MLLGTAAILWMAAAVYAATCLHGEPNNRGIAAWWLTAMIGNFGVFMAADIASFYLFFAMGSIGAYGLIIHNMTPVSRRAGVVYVGFALVGEACVLMGLVLLAAGRPSSSLLISDAVAALPTSPWRDAALVLLIIGFGLKIGLVPFYAWMPLAYTAAPAPAAAVLSGAAVKAGVIGLIRFLPFDTALPGLGAALASAGIISTFYGVAIGINRSNPKTVLAYSSVSQMGVIATLLGMGLAIANTGVTLAAGFYAAHHVLVKGALFLATGIVLATGSRNRWLVLVPAAIVALGLAGLPFTGGYLAKAAIKPFIGEGAFGIFAALSSAGTALLMLYFIDCLMKARPQSDGVPEPAGLTLPWLVMVFVTIAVPWMLLPSAMPSQPSDLFGPWNLWDAIWPILIGGACAIGWSYRPRKSRLPSQGISLIVSATRACASAFERTEAILRQWQSAGISLLAITVLLAVVVASGR
jgi:multicomponent Na+:H+ antiporter subunit A